MRGVYNTETNSVDFTATHFSKYAVGYNKVTFADVADDAWYNDAVSFLAARSITVGIGDNRFGPENTLSNYADAGHISDYAQSAMKTFVESGIISGSHGYLSPEAVSTRAQMSQVLYNLLSE